MFAILKTDNFNSVQAQISRVALALLLTNKKFEHTERKSGATSQILVNSVGHSCHFEILSLPRKIRISEYWELLLGCLGNELTNHKAKTAFSWPGCLFLKMADEEGTV